MWVYAPLALVLTAMNRATSTGDHCARHLPLSGQRPASE